LREHRAGKASREVASRAKKRSGRSFAAYSTSSSDPAAMTDDAEQRVDAAAAAGVEHAKPSKSLLTELLHARK
jgi:hypothetical protein